MVGPSVRSGRRAASRCQQHAQQLSSALASLPGVLPPAIPATSSSVHHKFSVRIDMRRAGVDLPARTFRDALLEALHAEGMEVVLWQDRVLLEHRLFHERVGFGRGWPWSADSETDFDRRYDPQLFPAARGLLDSSIVLFSQSYPLIAQDTAMVDRYAEAFARVWEHREAVCAWARARGQ